MGKGGCHVPETGDGLGGLVATSGCRARCVTARLIELKLLVVGSHRSPLRLGIPLEVVEH